MDTYFPEEDGEETGIGGAQVDEQGAFAFQSDLAAPQGGFSFVSPFSHSFLPRIGC
jgi:importin subunit alpha-1